MGYWRCPNCKRERAAACVTYEEKCDRCGYSVEWIEPEEYDRTSGLTFGEALELCRPGEARLSPRLERQKSVRKLKGAEGL
jgi:hypothetical protein